ncbi:MAG: SsgA family sporulation/cell division regulator [Actinobacteria bacterium]|nr:SsgA family sporulation/cell division regulator [Micrococcales bacterium]MCB9429798.1 SsgA family sporulation/cell division regulator [Actinomycetota bacterium]HPQ85247.1 SsgA family sporulation/cell division regulator [Actinomycetota bacterium]HRV67242.1 SsgA family sporulation/cell division regulator [Candidatus Nanopelagicales bacterium]
MSSSGAEVTQVVSTTLVGRDEIVAAQFIFRCDGPFAVSAVFTAGGTQVLWTFARELLRDGLYAPAGGGDVMVAPAGRGRVTLTLSSASGVAMLACDGADLAIFVQRVYAAVPEGEESTGMAMDRFLADIA